MSNLVLYSMEVSPPCRAVILAAECLGIPLTIKTVDLHAHENTDPEFLKINPLHTIPTLDDNGFYLTDSHAIICYLVEKYGKDDTLYPKDLQKRALVDQFLHTDCGTLFATMKGIFRPIVTRKVQVKNFHEDDVEKVKDMYVSMNSFLEGKDWLVGGSHFTLADISCMSTILSMTIIFPIKEYPHLDAWIKRCEKHMPKYDTVIVPGHKMLKELLNSRFQ